MYEADTRPDLSLDEIRRWVRRFRYDPEFRDRRGARTVPILQLCQFAGVPKCTLYRVLSLDLGLSPNCRRRLTVAIRAVEAGLRWRRLGDHSWSIAEPQRWQSLPRYERPKYRKERWQDPEKTKAWQKKQRMSHKEVPGTTISGLTAEEEESLDALFDTTESEMLNARYRR